MPLLLALLLAVLHALAGPLPVRLQDTAPGRAAARAQPAAQAVAVPVRRPSAAPSLHRGARRPLHETLDVARPFSGAVATRGEAPTGHVPPAAVSAAPPRLSWEATLALDARARALAASHAVAARGALLPYFPTAPPLQG